MSKETLQSQRKTALWAARRYLTKMNIQIADVDAKSFHAALDDLYRINPNKVSTQWYANASSNQMNLFYREARQMIKEEKSDRFVAQLAASF